MKGGTARWLVTERQWAFVEAQHFSLTVRLARGLGGRESHKARPSSPRFKAQRLPPSSLRLPVSTSIVERKLEKRRNICRHNVKETLPR